MKTTLSHSIPSILSRRLSVGLGCTLALLPLAAPAQTASPEKVKAAQPQPGDPAASKKGELNQANPGGTVKLTDAEVAFVKAAGAGNAAEIKMGELALKNAASPDVKAFAQMMIKDHTAANEELGMVAKNHNITFPPDAPEKEKALGMKMLDVKGAAFDKAYMNHAVEDHTEDVAEYKKAKGVVKDGKLVAYVNKVGAIVAGHLDEAKKIAAKM